MSFHKQMKKLIDDVIKDATKTTKGNVVLGDFAGGNITKQTIVGDGNVQSVSSAGRSCQMVNGLRIDTVDGEVSITGDVDTVYLNNALLYKKDS